VSFHSGDQHGFSLVELLIAVAIISIIGLMAGSYSLRVEKKSVYNKASLESLNLVDEASQVIVKNLLYRSGTVPTVANQGKSLSFTRRSIVDNAFAGENYDLTFQTLCRTGSGLAQSYGDLQSLYQSAELNKISSCLQLSSCPVGNVPYIQISVNAPPGSHVANYSRSQFPTNSSESASDVLGSAVCFHLDPMSSQILIVVQALYGKGEGNIGVVGRETIHKIDSFGFKILQQ
jgi:prepilin-type N-terminal cleavage/methylation domain-containing protein